MKHTATIVLAAATLFAACRSENSSSSSTTTTTTVKVDEKSRKDDILKTNIDSTVNPADDFFRYANGGWVTRTAIPASESSWGIGDLVEEDLYLRKRSINVDAAKKSGATGIEKQIGDFWTIAMDSAAAEQQGIGPLQDGLNRIAAVQSREGVLQEMARLHADGVGVFFSETVAQDSKRSDAMAYYLSQGGLGLLNRDFYFNKDERSVKIRAAYPGYVQQIFRLSGVADSVQAAAKAKAVIALETRLAKASRTLEATRDPYKNYNKMALSDLQRRYPAMAWSQTLRGIGLPQLDSVIVGQPEFLQALDGIIKTEAVQTVKDYMTFHYVRTFSPYLSNAFVQADFDFYKRIMRGTTEQRERWKRVLDAEEAAIGDGLGKIFVKEFFSEKSKARYSEMVEAIREAYRKRIAQLDWMSDSTKQKAYTKLAAMKKKVGYPDRWKDFSAMKVGRRSFAENMLESNRWWNRYVISKLGHPVDRTEWEMTPQTYNAYYNASNNEIVLPAGIFTIPGYRDEDLDEALVYGYAAASTIGHEITHGFDDEGRQYDEYGNLQSWWTKKDEQQFNQRADVLVKQFNGMVVVDKLHINGRATLGENLADLGGILLGVDAFMQTESYKKDEKISGLTPMQRFFMGYALGWLYKQRPDELAVRLTTDVHSPAMQRVNGPMPNVAAFYEAFGVKPGNKMYLAPEQRVRLW